MLRILVCCLTGFCFLLLRTCWPVPNLLTVLQCRLDQSAGDPQQNYSRFCTVAVYISCGTMASGASLSGRPKSDRSGVTFLNELRQSWNEPKTFVDLHLPGVVVLDTTVVPDVLGLNAFRGDDELVQVLPGASPDTIWILVPDERVEPRGFHDILLEDMKAMSVRPAAAVDMTEMKQLWPQSILSDMSKRHVELTWRDCKRRFSGLRSGSCPHCESNISYAHYYWCN